MPDTLTGLIERVAYLNPENGFAVFKVRRASPVSLVDPNAHPALHDVAAESALHGGHQRKKPVVLAGTKKALGMTVRRQDTARRCTALKGRLQDK